ncbi:Gp37-like protein [Angustibacter sp. McL0619]|uniref:Gp37-like protein n=1 Tax=Angustibacter sp. McL0619 TaxID=3415676 RepID=UPI003CF9317B
MAGPWTLRVRKADLSSGRIINDWQGALDERWNIADTLQVTGRWDALWPLCQTAPTLGVDQLDGGCTLSDGSGRRFSGVLADVDYEFDGDQLTLTFESDLIHLWDRDVYPDPAHVWESQATDYDVQTSSPAETVALHYIDKNAGPGAVAARRVSGLVVPSSLGRGGTIDNLKARFDSLGRLVADIAIAAGLRVTVLQDEADLNVTVTASTDRTATARFGSGYSGGTAGVGQGAYVRFSRPDLTRGLVAGGGLGALRVLREREDTAAETAWGRRIEQTVDQSSTSDTGELDKAGDDALATGAQPVQLNAPVIDLPDLRLGVDVQLGDLVTVDLRRWVVQDRLQQITTVISGDPGSPTVTVTGVIGSDEAGLTRTQKEFLAMKRQLRKVVSQ